MRSNRREGKPLAKEKNTAFWFGDSLPVVEDGGMGSLTLTLQITPNARRSEVVGWLGDRLKVKIKAPAVEGKANAELVRFLAELFGVRANAVVLLRGETARLKVVRIEGVDESVKHSEGFALLGSPAANLKIEH